VAPRGPAAADAFHFVGVQAARSEAFASVETGHPRRSIGDLYDELVAKRPGSVVGFVCDAAFDDIGTVADYWHTSLAFIERAGGHGWLGRRLGLGAGCRVTRSMVWDDVRIGPGAVLEECIVTDRVEVPAGSAFRRKILHMDAEGRLLATPFGVE